MDIQPFLSLEILPVSLSNAHILLSELSLLRAPSPFVQVCVNILGLRKELDS